MRPNFRRGVNKRGSARRFRKNAHRTKGANMRPQVMRGGIRF